MTRGELDQQALVELRRKYAVEVRKQSGAGEVYVEESGKNGMSVLRRAVDKQIVARERVMFEQGNIIGARGYVVVDDDSLPKPEVQIKYSQGLTFKPTNSELDPTVKPQNRYPGMEMDGMKLPGNRLIRYIPPLVMP